MYASITPRPYVRCTGLLVSFRHVAAAEVKHTHTHTLKMREQERVLLAKVEVEAGATVALHVHQGKILLQFAAHPNGPLHT